MGTMSTQRVVSKDVRLWSASGDFQRLADYAWEIGTRRTRFERSTTIEIDGVEKSGWADEVHKSAVT